MVGSCKTGNDVIRLGGEKASLFKEFFRHLRGLAIASKRSQVKRNQHHQAGAKDPQPAGTRVLFTWARLPSQTGPAPAQIVSG